MYGHNRAKEKIHPRLIAVKSLCYIIGLNIVFMFWVFSESTYANEKSEIRPVRLSLGLNNKLTIGNHLPVFNYDGRKGVSFGKIVAMENGRADIYFPAENTIVPPLLIVPPNRFARVEITPNDLVGWIDFCSGEAELDFDARFVPVIFGRQMADLSVITTLTTAISSGQATTLHGYPMNGLGDIQLVGVAEVPRTEDGLVNGLLRLPNDAATDMQAHLHFPEGRFACPGQQPVANAKAGLTIGQEGKLRISRWPTFRYDPEGANVTGSVDWIAGSIAHVTFPSEALTIPPLKIIGKKAPSGIGVLIETHSLSGTIDVCTGEINLAFEATFIPYVLGRVWEEGISIVTQLTTESSQGFFREEQGARLDKWGNAILVGVAKVPKTEDKILSSFLRLPTDAVAKLPAHIDIEDTEANCLDPA